MASTGGAFFLLLVICSSCVFSVAASIDGRPRPANFPDQPTTTYDQTPALSDANGLAVDCTWYGFANELYDPATTASCLTVLRLALTNATVNPPAQMKPYIYYTLKRLVDPTNNQSYCYQGCFNLGGSLAPTPGVVGAAPPVGMDAPPPVTSGVPPSSFSPVPSATPDASPPVESPAPLGAAVPPVGDAPASGPSSGLGASPPAPPILIPNSGAFLQPGALLSFLVAFVAVFVNFAA
ncbi:hypothetical protein M758_3G176200 [Ceratodon purpureus]|nr:hypothetical protein M758_3G176200 [Ceratodon purpureus]